MFSVNKNLIPSQIPNLNNSYINNDGSLRDASIQSWNIASGVIPIVGTWSDYSALSTISGFSVFTAKYIYYTYVNNIVFINFKLAGTSNASAVTFTIPSKSNTNPSSSLMIVASFTNGTQTSGVITMSGGSSTVNCYPTVAGGSWVNGTSFCEGQFWYVSS